MVSLILQPFQIENVVSMEQQLKRWAIEGFDKPNWERLGGSNLLHLRQMRTPLHLRQIAKQMEEIGDINACAYLEEELNDKSTEPSVRMTVVTVLGEIGMRQHLDVIEQQCLHPEGIVRKVALKAFKNICRRFGEHQLDDDPKRRKLF